ncbi:cyclin-domain-containing protein [Lindgomyces ingoldianus]|uniref:Cyclin-domain-containing protein n=1 Tax=Lindgomyces ingoldianus TaxID=673940 RepID=A0ACB6QYV8_9PLEO|nr:cyclin-domain-containing protein [Lindgomyces ingoldianus]KAF2471381.1 cyclin-domain-containing protein [Lindgomyces ingoldianus]
MLTSSPTISAPSSPSAAFHTRARSYHASAASTAPSPRFLPSVNGAPSRSVPSLGAPHTSNAAMHSLVPTFTRSPQIMRREYSDAGTQYTPPGYPPTYHRPPPDTTPAINLSLSEGAQREVSRAESERRGTSAKAIVTEPTDPDLRINPQPVVPAPNAQLARRYSASGEPQVGEQSVSQGQGQGQASTAPTAQPSTAKRARQLDPNDKVLPLKYEDCDVKDLGVLISDMLMELVRLNEEFPFNGGQLTRFHSRAPPGISVRDYLNRLIVHATLSPPILLSMVFYLDKLCTMYPAFKISSLTVHRFLITAATVAAKGLSDSFWTNSLYARVGGVSVRELALLELEFLRQLEWRIVPKPETLVDYYKGLVERGAGYVMERDPESAQAPGSPAQNPQLSSSTAETDAGPPASS